MSIGGRWIPKTWRGWILVPLIWPGRLIVEPLFWLFDWIDREFS